jgi:hypothetical protein
MDQIHRGFPGDATQYLHLWSPAFLFDHVCMLHAIQMKQVKQVKQMKQTASGARFKKPTSESLSPTSTGSKEQQI